MNKQKTLIFSLSAILFLALSFIVYSWNEPTTNMPSGYTAPLNTSSIAQTKTGEIGASMFRDADNGKYYINPSGDSVISGKIVTDYDVQDDDSSSTLTTKDYVDLRIGNTTMEDTPAAKLYFVQGITNPSCPSGTTEVSRHWVAKTCYLSGGWTVYFSGGWYGVNDTPAESTDYRSCSPDYYDSVMCAGPDPANMLFAIEHSSTDCTNAGGTVETVEGNIKICKFSSQNLIGNCLNYIADYYYTDTCACPIGWKSYREWSKTSTFFSGYTAHEWSNIAREKYFDGEAGRYFAYVDYKGCY